MIRKRRVITVAAVTAALVLGCLLLRSPEPRHQGRKLSTWLRDFDADSPQSRAEAALAVRQIGTNAVPFLIQRLNQPKASHNRLAFNIRATIAHLLSKHSIMKLRIPPPGNPRHQALAAIDALGPVASNTLPALAGLLHENPPDPRAPYVISRIGPAGSLLLHQALTNNERFIRTGARLLLDTNNLRSPNLFPKPDAEDASFDRRICEFNLRMLQAALQEYKQNHPEINLVAGTTNAGSPEAPPTEETIKFLEKAMGYRTNEPPAYTPRTRPPVPFE